MRDKVYWLVGPGLKVRHAVRVHPGALPHGEFVPTVCERWIRIPFSTPYGREPASKGTTARCPDCVQYVLSNEPLEIVWDS